jgi:diguanylate cyclase (GGDEF)-like protein/PAS domain S-box-containing protein
MRLGSFWKIEGLGVVEVLLACCLVGFIAWLDLSLWYATLDQTNHRLDHVSQALSRSVDSTVRLAHVPVAAVVAELQDEARSPLLSEKLSASMKALIKSSQELDSLSITDASGQLIASSVGPAASGLSLSDRDYFKQHSKRLRSGPVIGDPVVSRLTGELVIPVAERYADERGGFGGVVVATIRFEHFAQYFGHFDTGTAGSVALIRPDGILLVRLPHRKDLLGTDYSGETLFGDLLPASPRGVYEYVSTVDGVERTAAYVQSQDTGLIVVVSMAKSDLFRAWFSQASWRWACAATLLLAIAFLYAQHQNHRIEQEINYERIATREAEFRSIAEGSGDLIVRLDGDFVRRYVSPSAATVLGHAPEFLLGRRAFDQAPHHDAAELTAALDRLKSGKRSAVLRSRTLSADGHTKWLETHIQRTGSALGPNASYVAVTRDVTSQLAREQELQLLANTDPLTQLSNRRFFDARVAEVFEGSAGRSTPISLLLIDADKFKLLNDQYGHSQGDKCLQALADVCSAQVRSLGIVGRLGGEEIGILLPRTDLNGALAVAERIRFAVEQLDINHEGNSPWGRVTVSIGVASTDQRDSAKLFEVADKGLYRAKAEGRNRVVAEQSTAAQDPS